MKASTPNTEDGPRRILLVEDDRDVRSIVELALVDLGGMEVLTCATGTEALRRLKTYHADMILLDLTLPDMDGADLAAAMSGPDAPRTPPPPVVFLTGSPERARQAAAAESGVIGVLAKPFDPMTLAVSLQVLWDGWKKSEARARRKWF